MVSVRVDSGAKTHHCITGSFRTLRSDCLEIDSELIASDTSTPNKDASRNRPRSLSPSESLHHDRPVSAIPQAELVSDRPTAHASPPSIQTPGGAIQHRIGTLSELPRQPCPNKLLVEHPAIGQDDVGNGSKSGDPARSLAPSSCRRSLIGIRLMFLSSIIRSSRCRISV
jgi:hypothetical protein